MSLTLVVCCNWASGDSVVVVGGETGTKIGVSARKAEVLDVLSTSCRMSAFSKLSLANYII